MTAEILAGVVGVVLSLGASYIPGFKDWWDARGEQKERTYMGLALILTAIAIYGVSCGGWYDVGVTCDQAGVIGLGKILLASLIANQSIFTITKG